MAGRVLIVDDEPDIRRSLADLLSYLPDCETVIAQGFQDGLAKARQGGWDIIISDERMPDGRGVDLLTQLSREAPDAHRVLMSAFSDFDMLLRGLNAGHIDHFIQKPWDPTVVLEWVEKTMKERSAWGHARPVRHSPFKRLGAGAAGAPEAVPAAPHAAHGGHAPALSGPPTPLTIVRRTVAPRPAPALAPAVPAAPAQLPPLPAAPAPTTPEDPAPAAPLAASATAALAVAPPVAPSALAPLIAPAAVPPAPPPAMLAEPAPEAASPAMPTPAAAPTSGAAPAPEPAARTLDNHLAGIAEVLRWAAESKSRDEKLLYVRMALQRLEATQRAIERAPQV